MFPLAPGGIGAYVTALADLLAGRAEVTVVTTAAHERRYKELRLAGDPSLPDERVRMEFIPEPTPEEGAHYVGHQHAFGARVFERLCDLYPNGGPDLIEVPDYLGEGAVVVGARRVRDRSLANAKVAVRAYTTSEMCHVLDGSLPDDPASSKLFTLERYCLRHADCFVWPGGDVLETYRRFYGSMPVARAVKIPHPLGSGPDASPSSSPAREEGELRILYLGRLERRKGVQALVKALTGIPANWRLTLAGDDTSTAPLGVSMRAQLELMASGDSRIGFRGHVARSEIPSLVADHHVVAIPSRWECWPNVGLEALRGNRPIAVTPVGGLRAMVGAASGESEGDSGWIARDTSAESIAELFERLLATPELVDEAITGGGPRRRFEALTDPDRVIAGYERLAESGAGLPAARPRPRGRRPLVSVIVPYFKLDDYVGEAVESAFGQSYAPIEVIVVNDGSTREQDAILAALASRYPIRVALQANAGLGAARNFGIGQSAGRYVLPLDADNALEPTFVEEAIEVLEREERVAYVTSWARYIDEHGGPLPDGAEGYHPIGNEKPMLDLDNVAGDAMAVVRRRIFDLGFAYSTELTSFEDWFLYRELTEAGWTGLVIPRRLLRYRVRADSMLREIGIPNRERIHHEMRALLRERQVRWVS